jgi:hypothetical protein
MLGITFCKNNYGKGTRNNDEIFLRIRDLNVATKGLKLAKECRR